MTAENDDSTVSDLVDESRDGLGGSILNSGVGHGKSVGIAATSVGTGLSRQEKAPRDLDDKSRLAPPPPESVKAS